jgi:hypothetical protein
MSFENPKIKVVGIVFFEKKHGRKYYSKYYTTKKEATPSFDLSLPDNQAKFE